MFQANADHDVRRRVRIVTIGHDVIPILPTDQIGQVQTDGVQKTAAVTGVVTVAGSCKGVASGATQSVIANADRIKTQEETVHVVSLRSCACGCIWY